MRLPECFCWTRFGTEAGEPVHHILFRKEQERVANDGVFLWGIGNAIGPSIRELTKRRPRAEVLFSPIRSAPKPQDVAPAAVAAWTRGETLDGEPFALPEHSIVTSRYDPAQPSGGHYALVCFSHSPLTPSPSKQRIPFGKLQNLLTGRAIGASQVTAVVRWVEDRPESGTWYDVAIRAELVYPHFVRLRDPLVLSKAERTGGGEDDWSDRAFRCIRQRISEFLGRELSLEARCRS